MAVVQGIISIPVNNAKMGEKLSKIFINFIPLKLVPIKEPI